MDFKIDPKEPRDEKGNLIDGWFPASGGTETPFTSRSGKRLLYCWNPAKGYHAYLDCGTDLILTPEEAWAALGVF